MAIAQNILSRKLIVKVQSGTTDAGTPIYKAVSFSGVLEDAPAADLYAVGVALSTAMQYDVAQIKVAREDDLVNED